MLKPASEASSAAESSRFCVTILSICYDITAELFTMFVSHSLLILLTLQYTAELPYLDVINLIYRAILVLGYSSFEL